MEVEEIRFPDFRLFYKTIVSKTVWYWLKNTNLGQWHNMENPAINPCTYHQLIYNKGDKTACYKV